MDEQHLIQELRKITRTLSNDFESSNGPCNTCIYFKNEGWGDDLCRHPLISNPKFIPETHSLEHTRISCSEARSDANRDYCGRAGRFHQPKEGFFVKLIRRVILKYFS